MRKDERKLEYNSPVVLTFFLVSLAALLLDRLTGGWTTLRLFSVYRCSLRDPLAFVRLLGHVLGHANGEHFLGNMMLFLVVGPPMEQIYGSRNLLISIAVTAFITGGLHCLLFPGAVLLGASGVVFMLVLLSSLSGMSEGHIPLTLILVAALYLIQQVGGILAGDSNVAYLMHIVGGICGTCIGFSLHNSGKN